MFGAMGLQRQSLSPDWQDWDSTTIPTPPTSCFFEVCFFIGGLIPNFLDIRFRKVLGISSRIETTEIREGGDNLRLIQSPDRVTHDNLVLERGMIVGSALNMEFNSAMTLFKFFPGNALVILQKIDKTPAGSWLFRGTYPVAWEVTDLDSDENKGIVEVMELAYSHFYSLRI